MRARDHLNDEYKWIGDRKKEERNNVYYNELLVDSKEYGKLRLKVGEGNIFFKKNIVCNLFNTFNNSINSF